MSDIDLMSIWQGAPGRRKPVPCPGPTGTSGYWGSGEAERMMATLLPRMKAPFVHGCNDDFHSTRDDGVSATHRFTAYHGGIAEFLPNPANLRSFYAAQGLPFPCDAQGRCTGPTDGRSD